MSAPATQAPTITPNAVFQHPTGMYASDLEHLSTLQCLWVAWRGGPLRAHLLLLILFPIFVDFQPQTPRQREMHLQDRQQ